MTIRDKAVNTACKICQNHAAYIWGAQGQKLKGVNALTEADIYKMETSPDNAKTVINFINMLAAHGWLTGKSKAFDCSGLICYILTKIGRESEGFDMTADSLAKRYPSRLAPVRGCLVHRPGHIGIYIGDNYLIEAKGRKYGVVVSPFNAKEWDEIYPDPFAESAAA